RFMKRRIETNKLERNSMIQSEISETVNVQRGHTDEYFFRILLLNTGEINISEYKVVLYAHPEDLFETPQFEFIYRDRDTYTSFGPFTSNSEMKVNIYPQDTHQVAEIKVTVAADMEL